MGSYDNIVSKAKGFFDNQVDQTPLDNHTLFLCRDDGIIIYSKSEQDFDRASIGALVSGVWQAAQALKTYIPETKPADVFRLSFDTSSKGLYLLPVNLGDENYSLGMLFSEEINPGLVRAKMRELAEKFTREFASEKQDDSLEENNEEFLFHNITDDEVDQLFNFAGI